MRRIHHLRAVDGLRGLAILAVILYHLDVPWAGGGFLGVDVFFVISGFVITRLLRREFNETGSLDLRRFYAARVYRLMPALITLLVVLATFTPMLAPDAVATFMSTMPFTLTGTSNWYFISASNDYFAVQGRALLQHTWSLSVEAQYYLLWPLLLLAMRRRPRRELVAGLLVTSALAVAFTMFIAISAGTPAVLGSMMYFGTFTHLPGLFIGSCIGLLWGPEFLGAPISATARRTIDGVGIFALLSLIVLFLYPFNEPTPMLAASFPVSALLTGLVILVITHPRSRLQGVFTKPVMMWLGTRSYSLYLWHWPIFQLFRPGLEVTQSSGALFVRLVLLAAAAEVSYRVIEEPWRSRRAVERLHELRDRINKRDRLLPVGSAMGVGALLLGGVVVLDVSTTAAQPDVSSLDNGSTVVAVTVPATKIPALTTPASATPSATAIKPAAAASPTAAPASSVHFWAYGDSVLMDIRHSLSKRLIVPQFDGEVGRQATTLFDTVKAAMPLPSSVGVIMDIGNNGYVGTETLRAILSMLSSQPRVIIVNASVPRRWESTNNELIASMALEFPNVRVADWHTAATGHPSYFVADGVHLSTNGIRAYTDCVVAAATAA